MWIKEPYRIYTTHRNIRYVYCGFAGRFWFARPPRLASVEFESKLLAEQYLASLPDKFDQHVVFVEIGDGNIRYDYLNPRKAVLFVD